MEPRFAYELPELEISKYCIVLFGHTLSVLD